MSALHLVPLGRLCSAAFFFRYYLGLQKQALPFDWVILKAETMAAIIMLPKNEVRPWWEVFLKKVDVKTGKVTSTGEDLHHDVERNGNWKFAEVVEKYVRRTQRLHQILESGERVVGFTFFKVKNGASNAQDATIIENAVRSRCKGSFTYLTANLGLGTTQTNRDLPFPLAYSTTYKKKKQVLDNLKSMLIDHGFQPDSRNEKPFQVPLSEGRFPHNTRKNKKPRKVRKAPNKKNKKATNKGAAVVRRMVVVRLRKKLRIS